MSIIVRGVLSILAVFLYGWINALLHPVETILAGQLAGKQLESSDGAYIQSIMGMNFVHNIGMPVGFLCVALLLIWFLPVNRRSTTVSIVVLASLVGLKPANAYYNKSDYTEVYTIMPSESAFWVPDVGDNKNSQAHLDSEDYLKANKIPMKRFQIPHVHLQGSGSFFDFYVPAGRLIIVDRSPYSGEWVKSEKKGSSTKDESFVCQSKEGIDITVGLSIGVTVSEDNAPMFLSHFRINPTKGDRSDPNVVFASVYYGPSLAEIMDQWERPKIETLVCKQLMARGIDEDNEKAGEIIELVQKDVTTYLATRGITLDFIGWADTFTFSPTVQNAIDERYAASKISPVLDILKQKAVLDSITKNGWDGKMPSNMSLSWWPEGLSNWFMNLFHASSAPTPVR